MKECMKHGKKKKSRGMFLVFSSAALLHSSLSNRFVITCMHMYDRSDLVTSPVASWLQNIQLDVMRKETYVPPIPQSHPPPLV